MDHNLAKYSRMQTKLQLAQTKHICKQGYLLNYKLDFGLGSDVYFDWTILTQEYTLINTTSLQLWLYNWSLSLAENAPLPQSQVSSCLWFFIQDLIIYLSVLSIL